MTNPFERPAPQQPAAPANPYAQPQTPAPAGPTPTQGNPFGPGAAPQAPPAAPAQQPQYGAPTGTGWLAQPSAPATAPAPAYAPPATAPAPLNMAGLQGAPPPPPSSETGAKFADIYNRLVLFFPLSITRRPRSPQYISPEQRARGDVEQDTLTATIVVLDDGQGGMSPVGYGGNPHELGGKPHDKWAPLPYVRHAMWINQSKVIAQLRDYLPQPGAQPGMIVGRLTKEGPKQNDPWYLQTATESDIALATKYLELVQNGVYPHPLAA